MKAKITIMIISAAISISAILAINIYADARVNKYKEKQPFILKSFENCVAVYKCDELIQIFDDVNYSALPEYDRNQLKNGIAFDTLEEVYCAIEDYDG